jgi:hypothetical protein
MCSSSPQICVCAQNGVVLSSEQQFQPKWEIVSMLIRIVLGNPLGPHQWDVPLLKITETFLKVFQAKALTLSQAQLFTVILHRCLSVCARRSLRKVHIARIISPNLSTDRESKSDDMDWNCGHRPLLRGLHCLHRYPVRATARRGWLALHGCSSPLCAARARPIRCPGHFQLRQRHVRLVYSDASCFQSTDAYQS